MEYQLVLQWTADSTDDYDRILAIELTLDEHLNANVDGHDFGLGEMNVFILTDDPKKTFADVRDILADPEIWRDVRVAYRHADGDEYTILWPSSLESFQIA